MLYVAVAGFKLYRQQGKDTYNIPEEVQRILEENEKKLIEETIEEIAETQTAKENVDESIDASRLSGLKSEIKKIYRRLLLRISKNVEIDVNAPPVTNNGAEAESTPQVRAAIQKIREDTKAISNARKDIARSGQPTISIEHFSEEDEG